MMTSVHRRESVTVYPTCERRVTPTIIIVPIIVVEKKMTSVHRRESVTVYPTRERRVTPAIIIVLIIVVTGGSPLRSTLPVNEGSPRRLLLF